MHRAPAVHFSTARSLWHLRCILVLSLLSVASVLCFQAELSQPGWNVLAISLFVLLTTSIAILQWALTRPGYLRWDGHRWFASAFDNVAVPCLTLQIDGGRVLLVSLHDGTGRRMWLWLEEGRDAVLWNALRRAIVSSPVAGTDSFESTKPRLEGSV